MREVAIIGVGIHKFGRFDNKPYWDLGLEATKMALKDANIDWKGIQTAYCSRWVLPPTTGVRILTQLGATGIPICDVEAACASGVVALREACIAVGSGLYDTALALGVEKMPRGFVNPENVFTKWEILTGLSQVPIYWATVARRYMEDYGLTKEHLAKIAVKNHKNSVNNPYAMYQKEFTLEEILNSPLICDPLRLLEITAPNEGAAAAIVCCKEKAHKYTSKPVTVGACVHKIALYPSYLPPEITESVRVHPPSVTTLSMQEACQISGVGPEDIDVAEVEDTCSFHEVEAYDDLGFCQAGEAPRLIDDGATEMGGRLPVNVSGGLISKGEPMGASHLGQVVEIVWQLRGDAGKRQVAGARVGLAQVRGAGGNCGLTLLKR